MPHAHTEHVLDVWRERRPTGGGPPARAGLSLAAFGPLAEWMFVLARGTADWRVRSAGAGLHGLGGGWSAGARFGELWSDGDHAALARALDEVPAAETPRLLRCRGETARGGGVALELLLAPLVGPFGAPDRRLGLLQPLTPLSRLAGEPLSTLRLDAPGPAAGLRLVVDNTRAPPLG